MRKRTLVALLALTAVIALVAILPRTPPGRAWLLGRLTTALGNAGVTLTYRHSAGNPWTGVELDGASVRAPGVDLSVRTLKVHYFLPSLITGELPLSVTVDGVRGSVNAARFPAGTGGGGLPIRPRLQELTVSDASVSVQHVPYTLPSGAVSDVRIHQQGSQLAIDAQLTTADGSAHVTGTLDLSGPTFDGQVQQADARLARHWFDGVTAGTVSGPIHAGAGGVRADLTLQGGALDAIGLQPKDIHGSVKLRYPLVQADVQGSVLGGDVTAQGTVNIAARHWTAHAHGGPQLLPVARWLARNSLGPGASLPLHGSATTTLNASGWTGVHVSGSADGSGSFAGLPLTDLQAGYSYNSAGGVKVKATGNVAGGATVVTAATGPEATTIEVTAQGMAPLPGQQVDAQARLALAASGATGSVQLSDRGTLLSREVALTLDGGLNGDGWQAAIHGHDGAGATLQGAVALAGTTLSGQVRVRDLALPALAAPLAATLRADGPLTALPLHLTVGDGQPVRVQAAGETLAADLSGTVSTTLRGSRLEGVDAGLGPLALSGTVGLAPLDGRLAVTLARTGVTGPVRSEVAIEQGQLDLASGQATPKGTLVLGRVTAGPLEVPPLTLDVGPPASGGGLGAQARAHGLQVALAGGRVQARFQRFPLHLAGLQADADGSLAVPLGTRSLANVRTDLSLAARGASLSVHGSGTRLAADLQAPAGTALGPLTLARPLALSGTLDAARRSGTLQGHLGDVPLDASFDLAGGATATVNAGSGPRTLTLRAGTHGWHAGGRLDVGPLASAMGLPLQGELTADLGHGSGGYQGSARLDASAPVSARLAATGAGAELDASAHASLLGQPVSVTGTLRPGLALTARAGPLGPVTLKQGALQGSGTVPAQALGAGVRLEPVAWQVRGSLSPLAVTLDLDKRGAAHLEGGPGPRLAASLALPLRYAGEALTLTLATAGSGPRPASVDAPSVRLGGPLSTLALRAALLGPGGTTLASASGDPTSLALKGSLPAALLAAPLPRALIPAGTLAFSGNARLTDGRRYNLDATWTAGGDTLQATLAGAPAGPTVDLQGAGLALHLQAGNATLKADKAALAPLFPDLPLAPVVDGTLSRDHGSYAGALHLSAQPPHGTLSAVLTGKDATLEAHASGSVGPARLTAQGSVLPAPRLHLEGGAWNAVTVTADTRGPWRDLTVAGTLRSEGLDAPPWLQLPGRRVAFTVAPSSGAVSATGSGVSLAGTFSALHGQVLLPFQALGKDERLTLAVAGPVSAPRVDGTLAGGALTGTLAGDTAKGLRVDVTAVRSALAPHIPLGPAALASDVALTGTLRPSGDWQGRVDAALAARGRRLPVHVTASGRGADYDGALTLALASTPLARASISGSGARAKAAVDLAGIDYGALGTLLGVPLALDATGTLALVTRPLAASLQIDANGTAAGHPLSLSGHARRADVALRGSYGALALQASGTPGNPLAVTLDAPPENIHLEGSLALGSAPALALDGRAAGAAAGLRLTADPSQRQGRLRATLGGATLRADLASGDGPLALTLQADAPAGALKPLGVGVGGTLSADAAIASGKVALRRLALDLAGGPTPVHLALSGPAYPTAELAGTVSAPGWNLSGDLSLDGSPAALDAGLTLGGLDLQARTQGRKLARLSVNGRDDLAPFGHGVTLSANGLAWQRGSGFAGSAKLALDSAPAALHGPVAASLQGSGPLAVTVSAGPRSAPWATLDAQLARQPLQAQAWQGTLHLDVPVGDLAGLPGPGRLTLSGAPGIGGALLHPAVDGAVTLGGAVQAGGTLTWRGGDGHLTLTGPAVRVDATLHGGAWNASAALDALPLTPFVPGLAGARASLHAELQGGGTRVLGDLSGLRLTLPGASLTGTATLHDGIRAALQVRADLSAMHLPGPALQGAVHGPLVLAAPDLAHLGDGTLIALLEVAKLGPAGVNAAVDGTLQVGGSPASPVVTATLQGSGEAEGQLRASAALAPRRLELHSTLGYHALRTDLDVSLQAGAVKASGHAALGNAAVGVSTTAAGALDLQGANLLDGWHATVPASLARATVTGPLDPLGAGAKGTLRLTLGGEPWLDGTVRGASVAGIALGDLTLTSRQAGAPVEVAGPHLSASLAPTGLDWKATFERQPLPGNLRVSGDAEGHAASGNAALKLGGTLAGKPVAVDVHASRKQGLTVDAQGKVLAGTLNAALKRPAGADWQGTVGLDGAALGGVQIGLHADASGSGNVPRLDASATLQGAVEGSATVQASLRKTSLEADLHGGALGDGLSVSGTVTPTLDLTVAAPPTSGPGQGSLHLYLAGGALRGDGTVHLRAGPSRLTLSGGGGSAPLTVRAALPAVPGLAFQGALPAEAPLPLARTLASDGVSLKGSGKTQGRLTVQATPTPQATLHGVTLEMATLTVAADGTVSAGNADLSGKVTLPDGLPVDSLGGTALPYQLRWRGGELTLRSDGPAGGLHVDVTPATGKGRVTADLHTLADTPGTAQVDVSFDPKTGATGAVTVQGVTVSRPGLPGLTLGADVTLGSGAMSGTVDVSAPHGGLHLSGSWGLADLLPAALTPGGKTGGNAEARVATFDLATLPTVQRLAPHLAGNVSGVVRFRDRTVVGQLVVPDLTVADTALPVDAQISGTLGKLDAVVKLGSSVATATLEPGSAKGLLQFRSFPAQVLAEATTGATDITADVDGVMRFDIPYRDPSAAYLRMATQRVVLERAGVTTTGNLSWVYNDHAVTVTDAAFKGRGSWQAKGTVNASTLDFQLSAQQADFTPLLDLVPVFAHYGVGASGSFTLDAKGSPSSPDVTLDATGLEARVAGTHYRIEHAQGALKGDALSASAHVVGVAPLGGSVDVKGKARLTLAPPALTDTDFSFSGNAELPVVGTVTDLSGGITQKSGQPPQLALSGKLGNTFTARGSLSPFDVTVKGTNLDLAARPLFITSSTVDADLRLQGGKAGFRIGGELDASQVQMNIGAPASPGQPHGGTTPIPAPQASGGGTASGGGQQGAGGQNGAGGGTAAGGQAGGAGAAATGSARAGSRTSATSSGNGRPASGQGRATPGQSGGTPTSGTGSEAAHAARESVIFDHLHLKAPQRVLLDAGFGHAEASLDLTLTGTAASPKLDGTAKALRGTLTFAGRDFTIDTATASFQPNRGVYPTLDVQAHTEFEKQRVLGNATDLTFAAPRDSGTFQVTLSFSGQVQPAKQGPNPVTFDIQPTLSSNALVQSATDTGTTSPRPLSDSELLSLVTLGRIGVTPQLAGQSAFGTAVAQSALDTAVDVLVVSELQNALSKALGVDVVQIQTTPLSNLLESNAQPFGVALKVGGYLTPELFASYRLGNFNGVNGAYGFTNEVTLSYDLGPLNFDLSGRLSFPEATPTQGAVPELGVGLRYAFTDNLGLEAGVDLSDVRQQARFGVSLHW